MDFNILGPLEIVNGHAPIVIDSAKRRGLLCALISHANDVVSLDNLIEWIWQGPVPPQATAIVQAHISRLRRILEPERAPWGASELIQRRAPGYLLRADPEQIDAMRFQRHVAEGRAALEAGDPRRAASILAAGLRLWRGRPLADVAAHTVAQGAITRLDGLRLSATIMRIEADLELGRHLAVVPELEWLLHEHPLDERLGAQLMIALYRSGRQADALSVYNRMRQNLAKQLRIEPAPRSQRLRAAILAQHPCLDPRPAI
jgi:SARP family transcriptional regulator, regulator of embCAB operon